MSERVGLPEAHEALEKAMAALGRWQTLAHHFAEALVARWHDQPPGELSDSLADFMELDESEYAAWVECRFADVAVALAAREPNSQSVPRP